MRNAPAARTHALDRKGKKPVGGSAAPLRVAGGKMRADVAFRQRTEQGVGERVQRHVCVGMPGDAALVGNLHAAEHDVIAGANACTSKPLPVRVSASATA